MPAPAALMRSARLPCGTTSSCDLARAVQPVEHVRIRLPRKRADHLVTRPAASSAARPVSPLPALLLTMVRSRGTLFDQRVDQRGRHARHAESTDENCCPVGDSGDGLARRIADRGATHRPIPLLLVKVGQHLGSDPERRIGIRHTAVDRGLHQQLLDLIVGQPVTARGAQMHLQLLVMAAGYQGGECDQRPAAAVQALSRPDCAPRVFGDEPLKFRSEVGGRR